MSDAPKKRIIGHLDMDAFFAAVEERDNLRFKGMPLVVGADPKEGAGRGVVSTANYKAREYGIRSALPISTAWKFSEAARRRGEPAAIFLSVNMKKYGEVSRAVMSILREYVPVVEEASVDEAYFDLSFAGSYEKAMEIARAVKHEISIKEHLTASVGIGPNKLIAKIASDREKPDGLTVVREENAEAFLEPLSIRTIPGVGPKTEIKFRSMNIRTVKDAKRLSREALEDLMGKWGTELYEKLRARHEGAVLEGEREIKSISEQETFETDTRDPEELRAMLSALARDVHRRFLEDRFAGFRNISVMVRFSDFTMKTRAMTLKTPDARRETIEFESLRLFMPFLDSRENPKKKAIRLLGVKIEKFS